MPINGSNFAIKPHMIDYKQLKSKFTTTLNEFDKEKILKWIEFDQNREVVGRLLNGESANTTNKHLTNEG